MQKWLPIPIFLLSSSFVLITNYGFVDKDKPTHFDAQYRKVGAAKMKTKPYQDSSLHYQDADASAYYTGFVNENNSLTGHLGAYHMQLKWDQNPRFTESDYNYGVASLGWVNTGLDNWRWLVAGALSTSLYEPDLSKNGVCYGTFWGKFNYSRHINFHFGFYGYYGLKNLYVLPIIGLDYTINDQWMLSAVFPFDLSVRYFINSHWHFCLAAEAFGSPYRFPQRARGGINGFENGIFEIYSNAADLTVRYMDDNRFFVALGGGYNLGGWLLIRDSNNHKGKYYKFDSAPYGKISAGVTF